MNIVIKLNKNKINLSFDRNGEKFLHDNYNVQADSLLLEETIDYKKIVNKISKQFLPNHNNSTQYRNKLKTTLLSLFLGTLGAHHFYLKNYFAASIYILFSFTLIPSLISIAEAINYMQMTQQDFDLKYNFNYTNERTFFNNCPACGKALKFSSKPVFGTGRLKDRRQLCLDCHQLSTKVDSQIVFKFRKEHNSDTIRKLLRNNFARTNNEKNPYFFVPSSDSLSELSTYFYEIRRKKLLIEAELKGLLSYKMYLQTILHLENTCRSPKFDYIDKIHKQSIEIDRNIAKEFDIYKECKAKLLIGCKNKIAKQFIKTQKLHKKLSKHTDIQRYTDNSRTLKNKVKNQNRKKESKNIIISNFNSINFENIDDEHFFIYPAVALYINKFDEYSLFSIHDIKYHYYIDNENNCIVLVFLINQDFVIKYQVQKLEISEQFVVEFKNYMNMFYLKSA